MNLPEVRPGVTAAAAAQCFMRVSDTASNVASYLPGRTPQQCLDHYIEWATQAAKQLTNAVEESVAADYIYTREYWQLRQSSDAPRLIPLISTETGRRAGQLEAVGQTFRAEERRWQFDRPGMLVVPDTNLFLQADAPFGEQDWPTLADSRGDVHLVVPIVVVHELDRLKRNNNTRTAARAAVKWLAEHLPTGSGRTTIAAHQLHATTLEAYVHDGPSRPDDADAQIIQFAGQLASRAGVFTKLVTHDLGMRLRAEHAGVTVTHLTSD